MKFWMNYIEEEIYKDVKGLIGAYQVSNTGKVISLNYRRTGKPQ